MLHLPYVWRLQEAKNMHRYSFCLADIRHHWFHTNYPGISTKRWRERWEEWDWWDRVRRVSYFSPHALNGSDGEMKLSSLQEAFRPKVLRSLHSLIALANCSSYPRCELRLKPFYALGSSMCSFVIPAAMMVLLYTRLYLFARKHAKIMRIQLQQTANFAVAPNAYEGIRNVSFLNFLANFYFSISYGSCTSDIRSIY